MGNNINEAVEILYQVPDAYIDRARWYVNSQESKHITKLVKEQRVSTKPVRRQTAYSRAISTIRRKQREQAFRITRCDSSGSKPSRPTSRSSSRSSSRREKTPEPRKSLDRQRSTEHGKPLESQRSSERRNTPERKSSSRYVQKIISFALFLFLMKILYEGREHHHREDSEKVVVDETV